MKNENKEKLLSLLIKAKKVYNKTLLNKDFLIVYFDKSEKSIDSIELSCRKENLKHLTGIKSDLNAGVFYDGINAIEDRNQINEKINIDNIKNTGKDIFLTKIKLDNFYMIDKFFKKYLEIGKYDSFNAKKDKLELDYLIGSPSTGYISLGLKENSMKISGKTPRQKNTYAPASLLVGEEIQQLVIQPNRVLLIMQKGVNEELYIQILNKNKMISPTVEEALNEHLKNLAAENIVKIAGPSITNKIDKQIVDQRESVPISSNQQYNIGTGKIYSGKFAEKLEAAQKYRKYMTGEWITKKVMTTLGIEIKANIIKEPVKIECSVVKKINGQDQWIKKIIELYNKSQLELTKEQEKKLAPPKKKEIVKQYNAIKGTSYSIENSLKIQKNSFSDPRWINELDIKKYELVIKNGEKPTVLEYKKYTQNSKGEVLSSVDKKEFIYNIAQIDFNNSITKASLKKYNPIKSLEEIKQINNDKKLEKRREI